MSVTRRQSPMDSPVNPLGSFASDKTLELLDGLLRLTLSVRDLYENARCQDAGMGICHLRALLETHHTEQLGLVEVLAVTICALGGTKKAFAPASSQVPLSSYLWRGLAPESLLRDLLDAHALVLSTADDADADSLHTEGSSDVGFAVGRVVLTNDLQSYAIRVQLAGLQL